MLARRSILPNLMLTLVATTGLPLDVANRPLQLQQMAGMSKDADTNVMRVATLVLSNTQGSFSASSCARVEIFSPTLCLPRRGHYH